MIPDDSDVLQRWRERFLHLDIDSPLSHETCFKEALQIEGDVYQSLKIKRRVRKLLGIGGASGIGAAVASSSAVATTFFPVGGLLGLLGLGTAVTPIGWVLAAAGLSGAAWAAVSTWLDRTSGRVTEVPKWINTPLDLLAVWIFNLVFPLAVKVAAVDGKIDQRQRSEIERYLVQRWGYHERFVKAAVDTAIEQVALDRRFVETSTDYEVIRKKIAGEDTFDNLVRGLVEYTQKNPDCNAKAIAKDVVEFLEDVANASQSLGEPERKALLEVERAFTRHAA